MSTRGLHGPELNGPGRAEKNGPVQASNVHVSCTEKSNHWSENLVQYFLLILHKFLLTHSYKASNVLMYNNSQCLITDKNHNIQMNVLFIHVTTMLANPWDHIDPLYPMSLLLF